MRVQETFRKLSHLRFSTAKYFSSKPKHESYDAVIVGGGHNGLIAAAYLSKSGLKTCVLEKRHIIGGASVTEEIVPGFKFSRASYVLSLLRPQIMNDLELKRHGLKVYLRHPSSYTPLLESDWKSKSITSLTLGMDHDQNKAQIAQFSARDAEKFGEYEAMLNKMVTAVDPLLDHSPPDMQQSLMGKIKSVWPLAEAAKKLGNDAHLFYEMMTAPTTKILNKWFESEPLKATLATDACIGAMISPATPGSGYVLLHHVMGELEGIRGAWGYPEGGMGAVSDAIAQSAQEAGADIVVESPVKEILVDDRGQAEGVLLESGKVLKSRVVLSNATPKITFADLLSSNSTALPSEYVNSIKNVDYTSPVTKINVAVDKLPNFLANPNIKENEPMPHHRCTIHMNCEHMDLLEDAYVEAANEGRYSSKPMIEMTVPSSLDPTLAPPGQHVCLLFTQYTPYTMKNGSWEDENVREAYANLIFDTIEKYAPGFKASIVGKEVLPPPILEKTFGLTGGNIFHGSMALDQLFMTRPVAEKWIAPKTPISGLYLCGSGAHPGGGVMGSPGRLAAKSVAQELSAKWKFK